MDLYTKMIDNQHWLFTKANDLMAWLWVLGRWKDTDHLVAPHRQQLNQVVYAVMARDGITPPAGPNLNHKVKLGKERYSRLWLLHYYHLRHFQPCRQVASFLASRMTGEYHEGNTVSPELDLERLVKASQILARQPKTKTGELLLIPA